MGPVAVGFTHSYQSSISCPRLYSAGPLPESWRVFVDPAHPASQHITITANRSAHYPRLHVMVEHHGYHCTSHWEVTSQDGDRPGQYLLDVSYYHMDFDSDWTGDTTFDASYLRLITKAIVRFLHDLVDTPISFEPVTVYLTPAEPEFDFVWDL
jgi:hypothetical protein